MGPDFQNTLHVYVINCSQDVLANITDSPLKKCQTFCVVGTVCVWVTG